MYFDSQLLRSMKVRRPNIFYGYDPKLYREYIFLRTCLCYVFHSLKNYPIILLVLQELCASFFGKVCWCPRTTSNCIVCAENLEGECAVGWPLNKTPLKPFQYQMQPQPSSLCGHSKHQSSSWGQSLQTLSPVVEVAGVSKNRGSLCTTEYFLSIY